MNHNEIKRLIGAYVDGELHGEEKKAVEEHIKTCGECTREMEYIRQLNEKIKEEKISFPADAYWDTFPKRVMERAQEHRQRSFFTVWLPRMKWELAGGIVLLLLTFVVSKQILLKRSTEQIAIGGRHTISTGKSLPEEAYYAKDGAGILDTAVAGKGMDEIAKKGKICKESRVISGEEKAPAPAPEVEGEVIESSKAVSTVAKGEDVDDKVLREDEISGAADVAKAGGLSEPSAVEANEEAILYKSKKAPATKAEEVDVMADLETERDDNVRFAQASERSQLVRRGLLRLLYGEADRTRKRADIERAMREIEFYQGSYPEDFQDTLLILSDSLQQMIEAVEREEAEQTPAGETETE